MTDKYLKNIVKSQSGYASFVIVLITIIVVSLIVVAFALDSRLEQKNSLANVLATQAYYAAESGINDAYAVISSEVAAGKTPQSTQGGCASQPYVNSNGNPSNQLSSNVKYTCLTVNTTPNNLSYNDIQPGAGQVIEVDNANKSKISSITLSWQYYQSTVNGQSLTFSGCPTPISKSYTRHTMITSNQAILPTLNGNLSPDSCGAGFLQVDMVSGSGNSLNGGVSTNTPQSTLFFEPEVNPNNNRSASPATVTPNTNKNTDYNKYVVCNSNHPNYPYACTATINLPNDTSTYYLHVQTFYQPINLNITATDGSGTAPLSNSNIKKLY